MDPAARDPSPTEPGPSPTEPGPSQPGPTPDALRAALTAGALVGFLAAASADHQLDRAAPLLVVASALAAGTLLAHLVPRGRLVAALGGAASAAAVWLLGQRDDAGTVAILAVLFALGVGIAVEAPRPSRASAGGAAFGAAAMLGMQVVLSERAVIAIVIVIVAAGAVATIFGLFPTRPASRGRAIAFGTVLVAFTLIFAGYLGAETPDATWFGGGTVHGPVDTRQVALTFDDGPDLGSTEKVMQILDAHGVKGTFFEVGKAIAAAPQITRALYADGQLLGNHSYHHDQWRWLDPRYPELERTQAAFKAAIGTCPVLYRPPHGDRTPFLARVVRDHHMHMVLWSASAGDWATNDAQLVAKRILAGARPGAILLLHDGLDGNVHADRSVLVRALPLILDGLRARGLTPVRLDRLLGTGAYQSC